MSSTCCWCGKVTASAPLCLTCATGRPGALGKAELWAEISRLKSCLKEIRDVALCSDGVEFYAMLSDKGLNGRVPP